MYKDLPYPLDPLWVAEQSLQRPRQGVALSSLPGECTSFAGRQKREFLLGDPQGVEG